MRFTDKRFENNSAAIRFYVHLGIATENRTSVVNSLDDKIIKASQKEVVIETLLPVKNAVDTLTAAIEEFGSKQQEYFIAANKQNDALVRHIENGFNGLGEHITKSFTRLLHEILLNGKLNEQSLRNIIVLRSILYVFLLSYKIGRIEPNEKINWEKLVLEIHSKAQEISLAEIYELTTEEFETGVVKQLAREMFERLREAQNEARHAGSKDKP